MKPTKNNFFCLDSNKTKMRFKTEKKALNFNPLGEIKLIDF